MSASTGISEYLESGKADKRIQRILAAVVLMLLVLPFSPLTRVNASPQTDGNPDLPQQCGLDATIIIDRSNSIGNKNQQVANAANALVDGLAGTGSKVQVISFATTATALEDLNSDGDTNDLGDLGFKPAADVTVPAFTSSGWTNWDDALEMARRSPAGIAPLTIVLTDGNPTAYNESTPNGHGGIATYGNSNFVANTAMSRAKVEADLLKAAGSHILAVGVGDGINSSNLSDLAGDEQLTVGGSVPFAEADWTIVGFNTLKPLLEEFVRELCSPSINITKTEIPVNGQPRQGNGWDFTVELGTLPGVWETPAQSNQLSSATLPTVAGKVNFKWENQNLNGSNTVTISEAAQDGWEFQSVSCVRKNFENQNTETLQLTPTTANDGSVSWVIPDGIGPSDGINCEVVNREIAPATISVRKLTLPASTPGSFDFDLSDGSGALETVGGLEHGDTEAFTPVAPGTYSIEEQATAGYSLSSALCDNLNTGAVETVSADALTVAEAESWRCTFVNQAAEGSIEIVKNTLGADGTFSFESNFNGDFQLSTTNNSATTGTIAVDPGTYSVSESVTPRWVLNSATCSDGSNIGAILVSPGENVVCTFTNQAPAPSIEVTKSASTTTVSEPGEVVTFTVGVANTSVEPLEITSITDSVSGGAPFDVTALPTNTCGALIGTTLAPQGQAGDSASCTFDLMVSGNAGDAITDSVKVEAQDNDSNDASDDDSATVDVIDVDPTITVSKSASVGAVNEPGANVTFSAGVTNTSAEPVEITAVTDVVAGGSSFDVTSVAGAVLSTTCGDAVGTTLAIGASYSCEFTLFVGGNGGDTVSDTVTFVVKDDDGNDVEGSASEDVDIVDVLPSVVITKTAGSATVAEPGANVAFTFVIENTSPEEVMIDSLTDSVFGDITGPSGCGISGEMLAPADGTAGSGPDSITCVLNRFVGGNAGDIHTNVATVNVSDDDGNSTSDDDNASVDVTDVLPTASATKLASGELVMEPGAIVTFTAGVTNNSVEPVTITGVVDAVGGGAAFSVTTVGGDVLTTTCGTAIGTVLEPGESYSCEFSLDVSGNAGDIVSDTVTFTLVDDEGNTVDAEAGEDVEIDDVIPMLEVSKTAGSATIAEPGSEVEFTVLVTNSGMEAVTVDSLTDSIDGGAAFDVTAVAGPVIATTCSDVIGTVLDPTEDISCSFTVLVSGNGGDTVSDVVVVTGSDDDGNDVDDEDDAEVDVSDVLPTIVTTKSDGDVSVSAPGGEVTFTVEVENTSVEAVTVTSITDSIDGGEAIDLSVVGEIVLETSCEDDVEIAAGDTYICQFTLVVEGDGSVPVTDVVTVTVVDDEENVATDDDDESTPVDPVADLVIDKSVVGDDSTLAGEEVTYELSVTNNGPSTATNVTITDELPEGLNYVSAEGEGWTCEVDAEVVECVIDSIANGESVVVTLTVEVDDDAAGIVTNVASVESETLDPDDTNNTDDAGVDVAEVLQEVTAQTPVTPTAPTSQPTVSPSNVVGLAITGATSQPLVSAGIALLIAGAALVAARRRRN